MKQFLLIHFSHLSHNNIKILVFTGLFFRHYVLIDLFFDIMYSLVCFSDIMTILT